jgi:hypothetical protein
MNKINKLYKEFFGLQEQSTIKAGSVKMPKATPPADIKKMTDTGVDVKLENTGMVDEAQLTNHMTDYRGGVEYVLRDPAEAQAVAADIQQWAEKKGFTVVNKKVSESGKVGYFYFRLGEDPARDSQRIQGYVSQKPEIKHFRFNVRGEAQAAPTQSPRQQRPVAPAPIAPAPTNNPIV